MTKKHIEIKSTSKVALLGYLFILFIFSKCKGSVELKSTPQQILNSDGVVIELEPLWKKDLSEEDYIWVNTIPIFHKNMVIVPGSSSQVRGMLVALDTNTGKEIWRWSDYVDGYNFEEVNSEELYNKKENIVIYNSNNRFCALDLNNGTTLWKEKRVGSAINSDIQIFEENYYSSYEILESDILRQILIKGDLFSESWEEIVEAPIDQIQLFNNFYGLLVGKSLYREDDDVHAFLVFSENVDVFSRKHFNSYVSYNITKQALDFEKVRIKDTVSHTVSDNPVLIKEMTIINVGETIYGINKRTGVIIWSRKDFASENGNGVFTFKKYKDRLFAVNVLGYIRRVMELDPQNGSTKWIDTGKGGSAYRPLYFLNDVLYFVSRGDGCIYAYDVNSGKLLWKLKSPDDEGFMTMQVHEAETEEDEDMLVACSWKNAYRFEPVR